MIYFISDTHFSHNNVIKFCSRPFNNAEEMDEQLIRNWNSIVGPNEEVYHLGDVAFCSGEKVVNILNRLNGKIYLVAGNHDKKNIKNYKFCKRFEWIKDYYELNYNKKSYVLFHYQILNWNGKHHKTRHLFGHSHGKGQPNGLSYEVGVDNPYVNFFPISIDDIESLMEEMLSKNIIDFCSTSVGVPKQKFTIIEKINNWFRG